MSFGGHVNDMVNRVKQNAALKNARRRKFKGGNDYSKINNQKTEYDFPEMSSGEMKKFKLKIKEEAEQEQKKRMLFWLFTVIIPLIIGLAIFLLY